MISGPPALTREIAEFIADTTFAEIPEACVEIAKRCIVDGAGVVIAGSTEPCAEILRAYARQVNGAAEACTLGRDSIRVPAHLAALVNGVAGHALDWDDTALSEASDRSVLIHPTMQPLAAGLAVGEKFGASGEELLAAFAVGFEVNVKMAEAINAEHFSDGRGYHSSGTIGIFGATAAAASLMKLDRQKIVHAMALAATMAAGIGVNHGSMGKPLNMGRAAENGVTAAWLAALGMDGKPNALEGGRGFFEAFAGGFSADRIVGRLGSPYAFISPGISVKPYPSGVVGHPGMDAMKKLVTDNDVRPEDVKRIVVKTGSNVVHPGPLRILHAQSALDGKFCVPFQMAAMILRRKAGLAEFSDAFVLSDACQDMMRRVEATADPDIDALGKDRYVFRIAVETRSGATFSAESAPVYRGGPNNPLTWDELCDKFLDATQNVLGPESAEFFQQRVRNLENLERMADLLDPLTA